MKLLSRYKQAVLSACLIICLNSIIEVKTVSFDFDKILGQEESGKYKGLELVNKNPLEIIRLRGFKAELHYAKTKDGYYIHLARVVNPLVSHSAALKRPVIFNHGLIESSTIWLLNSAGVSPAPYSGKCDSMPHITALNGTFYRNAPLMFANFGYDVWLMSMRGTDYSMHHEYLTPIDSEFWDYSLDDFGLKDVPAVVDYVRDVTGAQKVGYIGHSQATFSVFALLSTHPSYADVIEPIIAIAPVAYFHHITSIARPIFLATLTATDRDANGPVPPRPRFVRNSITTVCSNHRRATRALKVCQLVLALTGGKGEAWPIGFYSQVPYVTSLKILRHFGILIKEKQFQKYDYGEEKNMRVYGSKKAPTYKIENIRSKSLCLVSTKSDSISAPEDVDLFRKQLQVPLYKDIFIDGDFNHFDMITDWQAADLVNKPMLNIFESILRESGLCNGRNHSFNSLREGGIEGFEYRDEEEEEKEEKALD